MGFQVLVEEKTVGKQQWQAHHTTFTARRKRSLHQTFDIGGTEILTYKQMLMGFARVRGLKRLIITIPVLTPKLSSLWLMLVTSTTFSLARNLVSSMKNEVVCRDKRITDLETTFFWLI